MNEIVTTIAPLCLGFTLLGAVITWIVLARQRGPAVAQPAEVRGDLAAVDLASLLTMLDQQRKSGALTVWGGATAGQVLLRDGEVVAAWHTLRGEDAVYALLRLPSGSFSFEPRAVSGASIGRPESLLMEAARRQDEAGSEQAPHA